MHRKHAKDEVKVRLKCTDFLVPSKGGKYCCPVCGSGTHEHGTGALQWYEDSNTWYCHSCHEHGDVLTLIQKRFNTDFNEALDIGARELGIQIDAVHEPAPASAKTNDFTSEYNIPEEILRGLYQDLQGRNKKLVSIHEFDNLIKLMQEGIISASQLLLEMLDGSDPIKGLKRTKDRHIAATQPNFYSILTNDPTFDCFHYNELSGMLEFESADSRWRDFTDADGAKLQRLIAEKYEIENSAKFQLALTEVAADRKFNPIKDFIEKLVKNRPWDGTERIKHFHSKFITKSDDAISQEASRLLFAGLINRIYNPGCKFDIVLTWCGRQGGGKSTMASWLALDDSRYVDLTTFVDKPFVEATSGCIVAELGEMVVTQTFSDGAVKQKISAQFDKVRLAYEHNAKTHPRSFIFIGTTNHPQFITDLSGGRRFLPILWKTDGHEIYARKTEIQDYILDCYAEAYARYFDPTDNYLKLLDYTPALHKQIEALQEAATLDGGIRGQIEYFLSSKKWELGSQVCSKMLAQEALGWLQVGGEFKHADALKINAVMNKIAVESEAWEFHTAKKANFGAAYGYQQYWERIKID